MGYQEILWPLIDSLEEFKRSEILLGLKCVSFCKYPVNKWQWSTLNVRHVNTLLLNLNFRFLAYVYASTSFLNLDEWQSFPNIIIIPILWFSVTYMIAEYFLLSY